MNFFKSFLLILIIVILGMAVLLICYFPSTILEKPLYNNTSTIVELTNDSTITLYPEISITTNGSNIFNNTTDIQPVNSDYVFNIINWSRYPGINPVSVHDNEISGPNNVINHTHIWFSIDVTINDPENTRELYREMAGVVIEIRQIIGSNSSPDVYGVKDGFIIYHVGMMPYDNRIYASDHYHPQAYKNDIYLIPGDDIYDYHNYTLINNSVIEP